MQDRRQSRLQEREEKEELQRRIKQKTSEIKEADVAIAPGDCGYWVPNSDRLTCLHCDRPFSVLQRRHHCRMCGEVVCGTCSPHRVRLNLKEPGALEGLRQKMGKITITRESLPVRVCTDCYCSLQTVKVSADADPLSMPGSMQDLLHPHPAAAEHFLDSDDESLGLTSTGRRDDIMMADVVAWPLVKRRCYRLLTFKRLCLAVVVQCYMQPLAKIVLLVNRVTVTGDWRAELPPKVQQAVQQGLPQALRLLGQMAREGLMDLVDLGEANSQGSAKTTLADLLESREVMLVLPAIVVLTVALLLQGISNS